VAGQPPGYLPALALHVCAKPTRSALIRWVETVGSARAGKLRPSSPLGGREVWGPAATRGTTLPSRGFPEVNPERRTSYLAVGYAPTPGLKISSVAKGGGPPHHLQAADRQ
jgi:hypothetical protein